jgi:hypothetical protein
MKLVNNREFFDEAYLYKRQSKPVNYLSLLTSRVPIFVSGIYIAEKSAPPYICSNIYRLCAFSIFILVIQIFTDHFIDNVFLVVSGIRMVLSQILAICICLILSYICYKYSLNNKFVIFFGCISLQIYCTHSLLLKYNYIELSNGYIFVISLAMAFLIYRIDFFLRNKIFYNYRLLSRGNEESTK